MPAHLNHNDLPGPDYCAVLNDHVAHCQSYVPNRRGATSPRGRAYYLCPNRRPVRGSMPRKLHAISVQFEHSPPRTPASLNFQRDIDGFSRYCGLPSGKGPRGAPAWSAAAAASLRGRSTHTRARGGQQGALMKDRLPHPTCRTSEAPMRCALLIRARIVSDSDRGFAV
jgi:hypothetical protein